MAIHLMVNYYSLESYTIGISIPQFHYLIVAKSGSESGGATASITSLTVVKATQVAQSPFYTTFSDENGAEAALKLAEDFLDNEHHGLKKITSMPEEKCQP